MATLLVIGTGMIGSSFARAVRSAGSFNRILGIDSGAEHLNSVLAAGVVDQAPEDFDQALRETDAVLVATPVTDIPLQVARIFRSAVVPKPVVFDTGSVKGFILREIEAELGHIPEWFVPAHPIAGKERHGPEAGDGELFFDHRVILTPVAATDSGALEKVRGWWQACGAEVETLDVVEHDRLLGLTSHLPHLLSFTFMEWIARTGGDPAFRYAAGGFRDFTRVAESDPALWREIFETNRGFLLKHLDSWLESAQEVRTQLVHREWGDLEALLRKAQQARLTYRSVLVDAPSTDGDTG